MSTATAINDGTMTHTQARIWKYMCRFQAKHGLPPTLREIGEAMKLSAVNGVRSHLLALVGKGKVRAHRRGHLVYYVAIPEPSSKETRNATRRTTVEA